MGKVFTYQELKEKKARGEKLNWGEISKEQLQQLAIEENLIDAEIENLYNITKSKVVSKRRKYDLVHQYYRINELQKAFLNSESIDLLSKAITEYAFRSGPIEDMHANNQLSQSDMMSLNKCMVNKIAGLLTMMHKGEWQKINKTLGFYAHLAPGWGPVEPDVKDFYV